MTDWNINQHALFSQTLHNVIVFCEKYFPPFVSSYSVLSLNILNHEYLIRMQTNCSGCWYFYSKINQKCLLRKFMKNKKLSLKAIRNHLKIQCVKTNLKNHKKYFICDEKKYPMYSAKVPFWF